MARPKVSPDDKIEKPIPIKFSRYDKMRLRERAKRDRIPISTWIRNATLEKLNGKTKE